MLTIVVPKLETFNAESETFDVFPEVVLELEHSLVSLSKWESKWKKPFLVDGDKTEEELLGYVEAMIMSPVFPPDIVKRFTQEHFAQINAYVDDAMTATWFKETRMPRRSETVTNELIRYWMVSMNIPLDYETRHLNQLLTLIRVVSAKNAPAKKMSRSEMLAERRRLNEERLAKSGSSG